MSSEVIQTWELLRQFVQEVENWLEEPVYPDWKMMTTPYPNEKQALRALEDRYRAVMNGLASVVVKVRYAMDDISGPGLDTDS